MVQYYTLEQAAQILQTTPEKVKEMAKKNEVRAFQDRGNLRFRAQEIDELARNRGLGSDPALTLGEAPPSSTTRRKSKLPAQEPVALIEDDTDEAPIGKEPASSFDKGGSPSSKNRPASPPPSAGKGGSPPKVGRRPTMAQPSGPKSPPPRGASDSDVRLVPQGSGLDFQVAPEGPKSSGPGSTPSGKSGLTRSNRPSKLGKHPDPADSGVRIVPLDDASDSDVKITPDSGRGESALSGRLTSAKKPSDSDIRLEDSAKPGKKDGSDSDIRLQDSAKPGKKGDAAHPITEEIDLDEEERRADAAARTRSGAGKARPKPNPLNLPTSSPFELSEANIDVDKPAARKARPSKIAKPETESSSDFELTPIGETDSSPLELSSGEVRALQADDSDEVSLGELTGQGAARSGINLQDPADSGISLEQGGSDEMELSLDAGATPKPGSISKEDSSNDFELAVDGVESPATEEESSSEFELALTGDDAPAGEEESSSEFELSLDADGSAVAAEADSDSEFELTLDPEGGLEASDETDALAGDGEEKDIFETDFEVPALEEEESGSQAVSLDDEDTDLETSDFDLDVEEGSSEEDPESGSQVVSLEDEGDEIDEGAETEARPRRARRKAMVEDDEGDLDLEIDPTADSDDEEEAAVGAASVAPPARWGALPAVLLIPSVLILFVVGLLTFELAGTMWNYRQPGHTTGFGVVLHPIAKYFDSTLPD
jgi:Helix-turn-helix domain